MIGKHEPQRTLWEADMVLPPKKLAAFFHVRADLFI